MTTNELSTILVEYSKKLQDKKNKELCKSQIIKKLADRTKGTLLSQYSNFAVEKKKDGFIVFFEDITVDVTVENDVNDIDFVVKIDGEEAVDTVVNMFFVNEIVQRVAIKNTQATTLFSIDDFCGKIITAIEDKIKKQT